MLNNYPPSPPPSTQSCVLGVFLTLVGILLMMLNAWLTLIRLEDWQWLHVLPLGELDGTLFGAGLLPAFFDLTHDA